MEKTYNIRDNHFSKTPMAYQTFVRSNGQKYTTRNQFQLKRYFFPDEWLAFYENLETTKQRITFNFLINTGARIEEVRNIRVKDVDLDRRSIFLRFVKTRVIEHTSKGDVSNRKWRVITISSQFTKWLSRIISQQKLQSEDEFPILETSPANLAIKKITKRIGIKDWRSFSVHNVRKTTENWLLARGVDSMRLCKHMGHDPKTANKYYIDSSTFDSIDRQNMNLIIGDLLQNDYQR